MTNLITAEELLQRGNDQRGELVRGEFIPMNWENGTHGRLTLRIARIVMDNVTKHDSGESFGAGTGFITTRNPDTVRAPDFAFIAKERLPLISDLDEFISIAPDLAVEVVSPNDRWTRIEEKVQEYLRAGVRLIWVIDPTTKTIHVYQGFSDVTLLTVADQLGGGEVLSGFAAPVARIFA